MSEFARSTRASSAAPRVFCGPRCWHYHLSARCVRLHNHTPRIGRSDLAREPMRLPWPKQSIHRLDLVVSGIADCADVILIALLNRCATPETTLVHYFHCAQTSLEPHSHCLRQKGFRGCAAVSIGSKGNIRVADMKPPQGFLLEARTARCGPAESEIPQPA
jgi:hypothetical protein